MQCGVVSVLHRDLPALTCVRTAPPRRHRQASSCGTRPTPGRRSPPSCPAAWVCWTLKRVGHSRCSEKDPSQHAEVKKIASPVCCVQIKGTAHGNTYIPFELTQPLTCYRTAPSMCGISSFRLLGGTPKQCKADKETETSKAERDGHTVPTSVPRTHVESHFDFGCCSAYVSATSNCAVVLVLQDAFMPRLM